MLKVLWIAIAVSLALQLARAADTKLIIPARVPAGLEVCTEYISQAAPREVQRSCIDAARVRAWLLANGRPADECSE